MDRHAALCRELISHVLGCAAETAPSLRASVFAGRDVPDDLAPLVTKIRRHAYKVTDQDLDELRAKYSEDELFEIIVCAALGAARERLEAAQRAIGDTP